ncbi:HlyD family efflux transporter periplasmic adaptor subunit [Candidatus Gracilibacteria bacterium]|nr:HlyD family efflux transporter periplasmic adaptor subunit [Candidatus Gracilibacteria bacterium]
MKKIALSIGILLLIAGCSSNDEVVVSTEKQDFIVETKLGSEFQDSSFLEKSGRVSSSQDILLTSNANGRIKTLSVKVGDSINAGQTIARLDDTLGNYSFALQRAKNGVERSSINFDSQKLQLDKQLFDAQVNLQNLELSLDTAKKTGVQNVIQAKDSIQNSEFTNTNTPTNLQIEQIDNTISRLELEYQNKIISDQETIEGFKSNIKKEIISLTFSIDDIIEFSDNILKVSNNDINKNINFDQLLGAGDSVQKQRSKDILRELIDYRNSSTYITYQEKLNSGNVSEGELLEIIDYLNVGYSTSKNLLTNLEITLNNSLVSIGQLSQTQIDAFVSQINGYESSIQGSYSAFISLSNTIKSFLRTYENTQLSLVKNIDLQKKDKEIQIKNKQIQENNLQASELNATIGLEKIQISNADTIAGLQNQILSAKNTISNLKSSYDVSLSSLKNAIAESNIALASAQNDYAKLTIRSPINGTVGEVFVDVGQEVASGTQITNLLSDNTPEIQVAFSREELQYITIGQKVLVNTANESISGTVYSLSDIADKNLNYVSTIVFESGVNFIGDLVEVQIPISTSQTLYPINIISTNGDGSGTINILRVDGIKQAQVVLGGIYGEYVEVISCTFEERDCENQKIIMTDISNYESQKFMLVEKK